MISGDELSLPIELLEQQQSYLAESFTPRLSLHAVRVGEVCLRRCQLVPHERGHQDAV